MKRRVLLVDEQVSLRQLLAAQLPREGPYEIAGESGSGLEAIRLHRSTRPHLVVLDLPLAGLHGAGLIQHLREHAQETQILVYCGTTNREAIVQALRARPHGFVSKRDPWSAFCEGLRLVSGGYSYFTPFATRMLNDADTPAAADPLTARQLAVVQMIAEGCTNKEIAARLFISAKTVDHHRSDLMRKLGLHDVASLTRYAIRRGLIDADVNAPEQRLS